MRNTYTIIFIALIAALGVCSAAAFRSRKSLGRRVSMLTGALIPPVTGNLILLLASNETLADVGRYVYFLGMDLVMLALLGFTFAYCDLHWRRRPLRIGVYLLLAADAVQMLLNPVFRHAFDTEAIMVEDAVYYQLIPHFGQTFHRVVDYAIFVAVLILFLIKVVRTPKINSERYAVLLFTMIFFGLWQTFYIFSRTPIDRSMVGFGVFGLVVFFFSLYYRPMRLLDRMLANIASELPEALFFFDSGGQCIWANHLGQALVGVSEHEYYLAPERLHEIFGSLKDAPDGWHDQRTVGENENTRCYAVEKHMVTDGKGRVAGAFLSVRDNTREQRTLQREIYNANHDKLTEVYNRAGYDLLLSELDLADTWLMIVDGDYFKEINDTYGHETGDSVLRKIAQTICSCFRAEDRVSRIGGDEFVVMMNYAGEEPERLIREKIGRINEALARTDDGLPAASVSVGAAFGGDALDAKELFEHADRALYRTKRAGRASVCFYSDEKIGGENE